VAPLKKAKPTKAAAELFLVEFCFFLAERKDCLFVSALCAEREERRFRQKEKGMI
jgi:hypothetical protein